MHDQPIQRKYYSNRIVYITYLYHVEYFYEIDAFLALRPQIGQMTGEFGGSREEG
jgi:hypothetical protein